uniref:Uncharacterized protein n=1 Tax=Steinernema glaseri TaxID=37863 RepID=A0A1I7Z0U9_9BILA
MGSNVCISMDPMNEPSAFKDSEKRSHGNPLCSKQSDGVVVRRMLTKRFFGLKMAGEARLLRVLLQMMTTIIPMFMT